MAAFDHSMKAIARLAGRDLARLAGVQTRRWEPLESTVQTTELLADRAFRAAQGRERFVVYMEFYTEWDADAPWDLLAKAALLSKRERLPTQTLVFILTRRGYRPQDGTFRLHVDGRPTQQVWFREIPLWMQEPQPWWEEVPGLMALYPLCRHRRAPREVITHAAGVIEARTPDILDRADLLAYLSTFGHLAFPRLNVEAVIGSKKMKESPFLRKIMNEGRIETLRANIRKILRRRFGEEATTAVAAPLDACADLDRLGHLFDIALDCPTIDDFRKALNPTRARR
jgi:hypothetical protein